ncbi:MAG: potassium/proton antiporter [Phycisphaerae bacterium]
MLSIEIIFLYVSVLIFLSILASKLSDRLSVPVLLLFLIIGMLAGSEGLGGIYFNDPLFAKSIGIVALVFIIFTGGIHTRWKDVRPVLVPGFVLATFGVLITAIIVGLFSVFILKLSYIEGMLLGSIVSSTDAAAVFTVLRSKRASLKGSVRPLLELESGSNDPMAVFLTMGFIHLLTIKDASLADLIPMFFLDMGVGALMGYIMAQLSIYIINRARLEYSGLYPVLTMSLILMTYAATTAFRGNGILAVYLVGLIMGSREFVHKKTIMKFHDGLAWLMQIAMFLTLGLLVFPSQIIPVIAAGLLAALVLIFLARPIASFLCLLPFKFNYPEKTMISWVGLKGAVPIILATFPMLAGLPQAETIFNIVFFVVLTSVLIQGTSIPFIAKKLKLSIPYDKRVYPIEFEKTDGIDASLEELIVPFESEVIGKHIYEIRTPPKCLIVLIARQDKYFIPHGSTVIEPGDIFLVLAKKEDLAALQVILAKTV